MACSYELGFLDDCLGELGTKSRRMHFYSFDVRANFIHFVYYAFVIRGEKGKYIHIYNE